ncbi:NACHT domain-containing protein [Kitasatospora sp. NPDC127111]|uniref:NACHT domain-containing protein n=1 Tax=Kitasatospora sp. NPDC127111 TaxID=3345363 RepID=UPI0036367343
MPPRGGLADKIGNRYEGRLAVLRLLQLLDEKHDSVRMRFEQPGEDSFEWWVESEDGTRTFTQVKRQLAGDEQWTVSKLVANGVIKAFGTQLRNEPTARCEFRSTLSASHLQDFTESAVLASSLQEFEEVFAGAKEKNDSWTRIRQDWDWWTPEECWQALKRVRVGVISEPDLLDRLDVHARMLVSGSPATVVSLLGTYLQEHLCQVITAQEVWDYLTAEDLAPNDWGRDPSTRAKIEAANRRYAEGVVEDRGPLAEISRAEAGTIAGLVTSPDGPDIVTVTGVAGMGKSDMLGQVVEQLTTPPAAGSGPRPLVLAARLDRLDAFQDASGLGAVLGLPESPALVLSRLAAGGPAVLVLDQVDAYSSASGRHPERFRAVTETVRQAKTSGVRVLLACRTFDFNEDDRMLTLSAPAVESRSVDLGLLPAEDVHRALDTAGIDPAALAPALREILRSPLHLRMLVTLQQRGTLDVAGISTRLQLFDKFFDSVVRQVNHAIPNAPVEEVTGALAEELSKRQELTAPAARLSGNRLTVNQLISAGWLREADGRIGFAHEAFFDYAYAHHHARAGLSLLDLLRSDEQHLFRRSQVRQILTLEREQDRNQYLRDVRDVLAADDVRPHIKELVIALVTSVPDPTTQEWQALTVLGDARSEPLAEWAHARAASSQSFGNLLLAEGVIEPFLSDPGMVDFGAWLCRLLVRNHPDPVAALLQPHATDPDWARRIIAVINLAPLAESDSVVRLFETLIKAGAIDGPNHDVYTLLYGMKGSAAAAGARIVGAYLQRLLDLHVLEASREAEPAQREGRAQLGSETPSPPVALPEPSAIQFLGTTRTDSDILAALAQDAPADFVHHILPVVRAASIATRTGQITRNGERDATFDPIPSGYTGFSHGNDAVFSHLTAALRASSAAGDPEAHAAVRSMATSDLAVEQVLAAAGFSSGHPDLLDDAVAWLSNGPFALAQGSLRDLNELSAEALAHVCEHRTLEQTRAVQQRAASATSPAEKSGTVPQGFLAHRLLSAIPEQFLDPDILKRRNQLDATFGARGATSPAQPARSLGAQLQSPVSLEAVQTMPDDELVHELQQHTADGPIWTDDGQLLGGATSFADVITAATQQDPERFAALLEREKAIPVVYIAAVLRGIDKAGTAAEATVAQALRTVKAASPHASTCGNDLAMLIARTAPHITDGDLAEAAYTIDDLTDTLRGLLGLASTPGAAASPRPSLVPKLPEEAVPAESATPDQVQLKLMEYGRDIADSLVHASWQRGEWIALEALRSLAESRAEAAPTLRDELLRLAASPDLMLRMSALQVASMVQSAEYGQHTEIATVALDSPGVAVIPESDYPPDPRILLSTQPLRALLNRAGWRNYAAVEPFVTRMLHMRASVAQESPADRLLAAVAERAANNAAAVATYACATDSGSCADSTVQQLVDGQVPERIGLATALSELQPLTAFPESLIYALLILCDDSADDVAKEAGTAVRNVPGADHPTVEALLAAAPDTRAFALNPEPAISAAKNLQEIYPSLVLDIAKRFFELHGHEAGDFTKASAAHAHALGEIVTSIYAHDPHTDVASRALDLIDTMVLNRSIGVEERLGSLDR